MTTLVPGTGFRRSRPLLRLLLAGVIFCGGAVVGAGATVVVITHRVRHLVQHPEEIPDRLTARLASRLRLTADQRAAVHAKLVEHQAKLTEIRRDAQPRVEREIASLHADIRQTLDAGQQQTWDGLYEDFRENWMPPEAAAGTER